MNVPVIPPPKGTPTVSVDGYHVVLTDYADCSREQNRDHTVSLSSELLAIATTALGCSLPEAVELLPVVDPTYHVGPTPAYILGATEDGPITSAPGFAVCMAKTRDNRLFFFYVRDAAGYLVACKGLKVAYSMRELLQYFGEKF
jgi:hypothetical protein